MVSAKGAAIRGGRRQDLGTARQEARPRLGGPKRRSQKNGCGSMGRTSDGAGGGKSDEALLERLEQKLQGKEGATTASTLRFVSKSRVQSLWAGYGSISEAVVVAAGDEGQGSRKEVAVVMKQVDAPSGSGVGHERKLRFCRRLVPPPPPLGSSSLPRLLPPSLALCCLPSLPLLYPLLPCALNPSLLLLGTLPSFCASFPVLSSLIACVLQRP